MNIENRLIIAGSGRSGTTWVLDVLARTGNYKTIFEPLHPCVGRVAREYAGRYIKPGSKNPGIDEFMDAVMSGELKSIWTDYRVVSDRLKPTLNTFLSPRAFVELMRRYRSLWKNYRIKKDSGDYQGLAVKFIRANLMLGWLCDKYHAKAIFVIRHPGAVVESKIRLDAAATAAGLQHGVADWDPETVLKRYMADKVFRDNILHTYLDDIDIDSLSVVEKHTLYWCIENIPVLDIAEKHGIFITCYEDLVANPDVEWQRILDYLDMPGDIEALNVGRPSQQASGDFMNIKSTGDKLSRWMARFSDDEKASIDRILQGFNVNIYSIYESMPDKYRSDVVIREGNDNGPE